MTVFRRALATLSALTIAFALSVAQAQSDTTAGSSDAAVSERDIKTILIELKAAWRDYAPCEVHRICDAYFESYGVALTFNDGAIIPFAHAQRLLASAHDCIVNARAALERGDRGLAVQWVMASYMHDDAFRAWLGDHPDTVLAALQRCCER
jgi:hypothetical protein